jgi:hypothetical protein
MQATSEKILRIPVMAGSGARLTVMTIHRLMTAIASGPVQPGQAGTDARTTGHGNEPLAAEAATNDRDAAAD